MEFFNQISSTPIGRIIFSGAIVNFVLVILGSLLGCFFKKSIPEHVTVTLMNGMALCVFYIGISGLFQKGIKIIVVIISFAIGSIIGEIIDFDRKINCFGDKLEKVFNKKERKTKISDGFVSATLLFCVGAMSIVGSIDSGIRADNTTLYSKSVIDCITAVALSSSLGIGVMLSAIPIIILEGGITLIAASVAPVLTNDVIVQISVIGSLLIIAISFNMLKIAKIKVMNYLPSIFLPILLCLVL